METPTKEKASKYVSLYLGIIGAVLIFGGGIFAGEFISIQKSVTNAQTEVNVIDRSVNRSTSVDFNQFWQVWDELKAKYVKQPIKDSDLLYGAIQGMVAGVGDPYTVYFPPQAAEEFNKSLAGQFSGIGAEIAIKNNQLVVVAPLPDTPAEKAGLQPGDQILAIDKKDTAGMDVTTAVMMIRGTPTSSVTLNIFRSGWPKSRDFTIHRANINVPSVMLSWKPGNIAYVRIMQFNDVTVSQFDQAIAQIEKKKASGIILDLRNNPGGYLDAAIAVASEWVRTGNIVTEKFSNGYQLPAPANGLHRLFGYRTIVLINKGSASASEIVAGALQDTKAATIVGETSFGKGSVQDYQTLSDGSALKVTVAEWYTPNDHNINGKGITPDVEVKEDYEKEKVGQDAMVDKALQLLKKK